MSDYSRMLKKKKKKKKKGWSSTCQQEIISLKFGNLNSIDSYRLKNTKINDLYCEGSAIMIILEDCCLLR